MNRIAQEAVGHADTAAGTAMDLEFVKKESVPDADARRSGAADKVGASAKASSAAVKAPTNRTTKGMSDVYGNAFNRKFGMFAAINMMNSSIGGLIQAQGSMSSKLDEQQAGIDQSIGTTYGQGVQVSNSNAQLIESLLSSLQQTSSQIAQSQIQDVSFVKGAN
jgi:hypothetical protein